MTWLAVDGEAISDKYALMCDNTGRSILNLDGLSTKECLDFLLQIPGKTACCFGLNYDANNWLCDLPQIRLRELWETGRCYTRRYYIEWIPGKWFSVRCEKERVKIFEIWGFFQSTFVQACSAWNIPVQDEISQMKEKRGTFSQKELQRIISYCTTECQLMSQLMDKLENTCKNVEITPRSWIGAGSLASALLKRENITEVHQYDDELVSSEKALEAVMSAYFGGRVEMLKQGFTSNIYAFDVNSAYPMGIKLLPSLTNATLKRTKKYDPSANHAIWFVKWKDISGNIVPFPTRQKQEIYYTCNGSGWYHAVEVAQAIQAGFSLQITEGYILKIRDFSNPFSWVDPIYAERRKLKQAKDHGEKILKLALNSVYGKMAQGLGFQGSRPPFQSYFWAGEITARTRARMLAMACQCNPSMIATDGVFLPKRIRAGKVGSNLGELSVTEYRDFFVGQAGVYHGFDLKGKTLLKSRGFFAKDVDYGALRDGFQMEGIEFIYTYESTRFIGLGISLQKKTMDEWRQWVKQKRAISLMPSRKEIMKDGSLKPLTLTIESEPYISKKGRQEETEDEQQAMDQPLRT